MTIETPPAVLARLIAKWREDAKAASLGGLLQNAITISNLADELAASLAQQGEGLIAEVVESYDEKGDRYRRICWLGDIPPVGTKLFTHPAAVAGGLIQGATDAADYLARNPSEAYALQHFRERMAALTAALQPAATSEAQS